MLWVLSHKVRAVEAQSSLGLGRTGGEKKGGRKAVLCFCSPDFGIYGMLYSLFLSLRGEKWQLQEGLRNLRFFLTAWHLGQGLWKQSWVRDSRARDFEGVLFKRMGVTG